MKTFKILLSISFLFGSISLIAQIKNSTTEIVKVYGNCAMCKSNIEKAGNIKNTAQVEWNEETKMATLNYNADKTTKHEILKRIALAGYDNEEFLAPSSNYDQLPKCCQYDRDLNSFATSVSVNNDISIVKSISIIETQDVNPLKIVFNNYFNLKDALIASDGNLSSIKANDLFISLKEIKVITLSNEEQPVWKDIIGALIADVEIMAKTKLIDQQRERFDNLSDNIFQLMKVSRQDVTIYYQFCPMANGGKGANWLSKESAIKNPYYGAQMLACGSNIETINN